MESEQPTRRALLAAALAWVVALPRVGRGQAAQPAAELPHLDEKDKLAVKFAYHADATKVDAAKYPIHKVGQLCSNCGQIQGKDGDAWRPCKIFPGKSVHADGWCKVWIKKPVAKK